MNAIKSAIVYRAEIPVDPTALHNHLTEEHFTPPLSTELVSSGFVAPSEGCSLVAEFPGGLAFRVRIDEKILPASVVKAEVQKVVDSIMRTQDRKPGKKERAEIKENVMIDLAQRALVRTTASITCFYHAETKTLIVPTTSKRIADVCTSLLVKAVGSVKTETLNISGVKHGLTTRLKQYLDDVGGDAFGDFSPCDEVALQDTQNRKVAVKMAYLPNARQALEEALCAGFSVTSMGFHYKGIDFRLTYDFRLRGIHMPETCESEETTWESETAAQVEAVVAIVSHLIELLSYQPEAAE